MEKTTRKAASPLPTEQVKPKPRKRAESPKLFYERLTIRDDIRRLLTKLAKL